MALQSKPFYWITCDHEGCEATCPPRDFEISAWADDSQAEMVAEESDWYVGTKHDPFPHLCPEHKVEHQCIGGCGRMSDGVFRDGTHGSGVYCGWCDAVPATA